MAREAFACCKAPGFEEGRWYFKIAVDCLVLAPGVDGRIVVTGFCFVGACTSELPAADPRIVATTTWYGTACSPDKRRDVSIPVYGVHDPLNYGSSSARTGADGRRWCAIEPTIYPGRPRVLQRRRTRYRKNDAEDAWRRRNEHIVAANGCVSPLPPTASAQVLGVLIDTTHIVSPIPRSNVRNFGL